MKHGTDLYYELAEIEPHDPKDIPPDVGNAVSDGLAGVVPSKAHTHMPSHLTEQERATARDESCAAATLMLRHAASTHYTQSSARWQGIAEKLHANKGHFPTQADCSSAATWWLWNALAGHYHKPDIVNGEKWAAGYTGTMVRHGKAVPVHDAIRGDLFLYGDPFGATGHVAMCVGHAHGKPYVISNGSEAGPFFLPYNYRGDLTAVHRYI